MNFSTAIKICFKKYFIFKGRARRSEFWYWVLFTLLAALILSKIDGFVFDGEVERISPFYTMFTLATFIPGLAVSWRRLHDINRSGWWIGGGFLIFSLWIFLLLRGAARLTLGVPSNLANYLNEISIAGIMLILIWSLIVLIFYCMDTKAGDNRFGQDPKYGGNASVFD